VKTFSDVKDYVLQAIFDTKDEKEEEFEGFQSNYWKIRTGHTLNLMHVRIQHWDIFSFIWTRGKSNRSLHL